MQIIVHRHGPPCLAITLLIPNGLFREQLPPHLRKKLTNDTAKSDPIFHQPSMFPLIVNPKQGGQHQKHFALGHFLHTVLDQWFCLESIPG